MIRIVRPFKINNGFRACFHMRQAMGEASSPRLSPGDALNARDTGAAKATGEGGTG